MFGGRRIAVPRTGTRPTTDRVRESLFNVLASRIDFAGASVLDLYAGSGALGLEALSRGATSAVFVESDQRAAAVIAKNIASLGASGATVRRTAVATVLAAGTQRPVDLVLADPPYGVPTAEIEDMLGALVTGGWANAETVVVVERGTSGPELAWPPRLGAVAVTPLRRHPDRAGRPAVSVIQSATRRGVARNRVPPADCGLVRESPTPARGSDA